MVKYLIKHSETYKARMLHAFLIDGGFARDSET